MRRNQESRTGTVLDETARALMEVGLESARREAEWLLMHVAGKSRLDMLMNPDVEVSEEERAHLRELIQRRSAREPLQYILGEAAFYGRTFHVNPSVLIPRPETEELVEHVLALSPEDLAGGVLDLGTGSGCIPITLALENPEARCTGVDLSGDALDVARMNAEHLGAQVSWVEADMTDSALATRVGGPVSILVSNPPYITDAEAATLQPEVRDHEPAMALFSGPDPLRFYRSLSEQAFRLIRPGGHVLVEIHADHGSAVVRLFEQSGLENVTRHRDMAGRDRIVQAIRP